MQQAAASASLATFNALPADAAEEQLRSCCAAPLWIHTVVSRRPYASVNEVLTASDEILASVGWAEIELALAAHPRIGQRAAGSGAEARWSRQEQSAAATDDQRVAAELGDGNVAYERRFDRVFLICATGLSAAEILTALRGRLENDDETEAAVTRAELAKIVRIRLERIL
ncbi:2-oxo-4-hydroxy-4-carboxy-5-ureidoimidazoline decarboxylase [Fodinicola feengrottensis]|uniref:2-oxo-4-hydroxy-4-carboxy-5-ureidoimidazoline decarboxylase n=1 Tax=Fodinicola feengrottensis TaxID=435914 RepID=A0ABP4UT47_9ACTN